MTEFDLKSVELFASLPVEDLARMEAGLDERRLSAGEVLFDEGDEADNAYIVASGEVEILKRQEDREARLAVSGEGIIIGEMALLTDEPRNATARALTDTTLIVVPHKTFDELINSSAVAMRAVFDVFLGRMREQELRVRQSERMAQLGVLTAGLAHEMNNPAAAVSRGAQQLGPALERFEAVLRQLPANVDLGDFREQGAHTLSALDRSDREAAVEATLDALGVADAWNLAPALVASGITVADLNSVDMSADPTTTVAAMAAHSELGSLLAEVQEGARRLSELVGALKSYSFLDQAPVQATDVAKGLEDTLLILKSKTKGIEVRMEIEGPLPKITAYGSQLNQVWTNLIDNAADAARTAEPGVITVRAHRDDDHVIVEVEDNGSGIPEEALGHVFEAFFTTKQPGQGTGIGLNTVYSIVVNDHHGTIDVRSEPGATVFRVRIPIEMKEPRS